MDFLDMGKAIQEESLKPKPWMKDCDFVLVTEDNIADTIDKCIESGRYALDLETTGLNVSVYNGSTVDKIVGVCLSHDGNTGYYIPIRHKSPNDAANLPWSLAHKHLKRLVESDSVTRFHNGKFDQEFLQWNGYEPLGEWDEAKRWEDTLILAYLADTKRRSKGLKTLSKELLGMEMFELPDLFPDVKNRKGLDFADLDPTWKPTLWYAGADAICTWRLHEVLYPAAGVERGVQHSQALVYKIEKDCVAATRWMERARVRVSEPVLKELIQLGQQEWFDSLNEVYSAVESALGRDVRPGWFRLFCGNIDGFEGQKFDPGVVDVRELGNGLREVHFQARIDEAKKSAKRSMLDAAAGSVTKTVPSVTESGSFEDIDFPSTYDILSAPQLGLMLRELEVPGLKVTEKSGQVSTSNADMDALFQEVGEKYPFMKRIEKFRSTQKALTTYLIPMLEDARAEVEKDPDGNRILTLRAGFNAFKADTGRFTASTSRNPEVDGGTRLTFHGIPSTYDPNRPECLARIREALIPRPGKVIVASDYAGVELRIVTCLSGEPKWMNEYFRCSSCSHEFERPAKGVTADWVPPFCPNCGSDKIGDIHTLTALSIYGQDSDKSPDFKNKRQKSKGVNFALCYGGSGAAVQRAAGVDENEGARIKRVFDESYGVLQAWWFEQKKFAKKHGYVVTALHRRCSLMPDIKLPRRCPKTGMNNGGFIAKAERNAVNAPIQGTSADITKTAMAYIYKECKKRGWLNKVHMLATIHDELVFEIDVDILEEAVDMIEEMMSRNEVIMKGLKWPVPLNIDTEIGPNWTVKHNLSSLRKNPDKEWPEFLQHFKKKWIEYGASPSSGMPPGTKVRLQIGSEPTIADSEKPPKPASRVDSPPEQGVKNHARDTERDYGPYYEAPSPSEWTFRLRNLDPETAIGLAGLLVDLEDTGTTRIRFEDPDGNEVTSVFEDFWGGEYRASYVKLETLASYNKWLA